MEIQLSIAVPQPGKYALLVEYATEDTPQTINVAVSSPQLAVQQGTLLIYTCKYRYALKMQDC